MKVVEMKGISKYFGEFAANKNVDFDLEEGEIHALLGENGAGKSTLMNILYGLQRNEEGQIFINGKEVTISSPLIAIESNIGMVHQHFMLIPQLTVTDNIFLGMKETGIVLRRKILNEKVRAINHKFGFNVKPDSIIWQLPVGIQQKVEILKVLIRNAKILILDEPTAVLTTQEVEELFAILKKITKEGYSIILITHKMQEVMKYCDRVTVMRGGATIATLPVSETDPDALATMMVGRQINLNRQSQPQEPGEVILELKNLRVKNDKGVLAIKDVNLQLRKAEIIGIAGVDGNGQQELGEAISGLRKIYKGEIIISGEKVKNSPSLMIKHGLGHIPDDRHKKGLVLDFSVKDNLILGYQRSKEYLKAIFCNHNSIEQSGNRLRENFDIRCQSLKQNAGSLSGGNQQKIILARVIDRDPKVILALQPTRGLDIGAIEYVRRKLIEERDAGKAILLISTDLDEILSLSDRICVMYDGKLSESVPYDLPVKDLGIMMAGGITSKEEVI